MAAECLAIADHAQNSRAMCAHTFAPAPAMVEHIVSKEYVRREGKRSSRTPAWNLFPTVELTSTPRLLASSSAGPLLKTFAKMPPLY